MNNYYHCCIPKTASTWFFKFWNDTLVRESTGVDVYNPQESFLQNENQIMEKLNAVPPMNSLICPFYIRYDDFFSKVSRTDYKAVFVVRDPRDVIVSEYYSLKYSHGITHPLIAEWRAILNGLDTLNGLKILMVDYGEFWFYSVMKGWLKSRGNENVLTMKYEHLFQDNSKESFLHLFNFFFQKPILPEILETVLDKYSFQNITGRPTGIEEITHHYRKGVSGDWRNYFNSELKQIFKEQAGELLVEYGYEVDDAW